MSTCKALTANGTPCKHSAKEGLDYCGIHEALASSGMDSVPVEVVQEPVVEITTPNKYKMILVALAGRDHAESGIVGPATLEGILQSYYNQGYEVHTVTKYDRVAELGGTPEHFWTMFLLSR